MAQVTLFERFTNAVRKTAKGFSRKVMVLAGEKITVNDEGEEKVSDVYASMTFVGVFDLAEVPMHLIRQSQDEGSKNKILKLSYPAEEGITWKTRLLPQYVAEGAYTLFHILRVDGFEQPFEEAVKTYKATT
jgi:hypothetical protein